MTDDKRQAIIDGWDNDALLALAEDFIGRNKLWGEYERFIEQRAEESDCDEPTTAAAQPE